MANIAFLKLFFLSVAIAFIASCASMFNGSKASLPDESPPSAHVWEYLFSYGSEGSGYATYSYVLVGRDENNQAATSLYFKLIKAILGSTVSADSLRAHVPNANLNLFLIPAIGNVSTESHEPNYELSKLLLLALSTVSPLKFSRPGPYIITLCKPISFEKYNEVADILYMDLTNIHPAAIPEIIRTYKSKILNEKLDGIERLKSLRISLLNLALIAEDSIGFARTAYAKLQRTFYDKL